ncbi:MAG: hypothetical protein IJZ82_05160 [Lachnospiraceae bacterium]|nr:hypothetical protein [Lachnospiraceae bacterium]
MSGICGMWAPFEERVRREQDINRLMRWNKAYGNGAEEVYADGNICLGFCRESFAETNSRSALILKKNKKYAVIDALIYNREELLDKGQFEEKLSDEELLFDYIEKFGFGELENVNGDFCGAIYDEQEKVLTLFRDHMGVRPLFYYARDGIVMFSTDIRGIAGMEQAEISVNEQWLWASTSGYGNMGLENTEFANIFCVKPASYMTFSLHGSAVQTEKVSYWQLGKKKIRLSSEKAYIEKMRELITDSVRRRLAAVPGLVGAELSGGLDSGVIDILIHRLGRECVYYSWSASPEEIPFAENDERLVIQDICEQEGIVCNYGKSTVEFNEESNITQNMRKIGAEGDISESAAKVLVLPPYINTLQISATSEFVNRSGARVVFTGHGGDEGVSHRCNAYELFYHREYLPYFKHMWSTTEGAKNRLKRMLSVCYRNLSVTAKELKGYYQSGFGVKDLLRKDFYHKFDNVERMSLKFAYDARTYVEDGGSRNRLDVAALLGAYSGARYIMPYLDYRVIDYAVSIPRHMYLKNKKNRYIFREAFKDIMPESLYVLDRKSSPSWSNLVREAKSEEELLEQKRKVLNMLDRELWAEYLDWDVMERWAQQKSSEEDEMRNQGVFMCISNCFRFQNMVREARRMGRDVSCEKDG